MNTTREVITQVLQDHMAHSVVIRTEQLVDALVPALQWQPIETAPRDGTKVLFYTPECPETGWLAFIAESFYDKRGELNDTHVPQWQDGLEPTHWRPRPPDPPAIRRVDTPPEGEQPK